MRFSTAVLGLLSLSVVSRVKRSLLGLPIASENVGLWYGSGCSMRSRNFNRLLTPMGVGSLSTFVSSAWDAGCTQFGWQRWSFHLPGGALALIVRPDKSPLPGSSPVSFLPLSQLSVFFFDRPSMPLSLTPGRHIGHNGYQFKQERMELLRALLTRDLLSSRSSTLFLPRPI